MRRRGPGLLRTAAVVGTATAVSGRVRKRQGDKWSANEQQAQQAPQQAPAPPPEAPAPPSSGGDDLVAKLKELGELHTSGVLDDAEFEAAKAKLLAG